MHLKSLTPLLLLLAATTPLSPVAATDLAPRGLPSKYRPSDDLPVRRKNTDDVTEAVITTSGTADAPVDGLDGKPHSGPGLYPESSGRRGSGEIGVSGGGASVDIKKPPPHTGEHEIVDIEDPAEGDDSLVSSPFPGRRRGIFILMILNDSYSILLRTRIRRNRRAPPHPRYLAARATKNTHNHRLTHCVTPPSQRSPTYSPRNHLMTLAVSPSRSTPFSFPSS